MIQLYSQTLGEVLQDYELWCQHLQSIVYVQNGCIVINVDYEYEIELSRCDSYEKILSWALHLSEKNWMTKDVTEQFILVALRQHSLPYPVS